MGGHPWFYVVPYGEDIDACLEALREREFKAGRYNPAEPFPKFPVDLAHAPGAKHASIQAAIEDADADGTRSILDIDRIRRKPDYGAAMLLDEDDLMDLFSTAKPTREDLEDDEALFESIERGQGVCFVVYEGEKPSEICFAGYSYD